MSQNSSCAIAVVGIASADPRGSDRTPPSRTEERSFKQQRRSTLAGVADLDNLRSIRDVITPQGAAVLADSMQESHLDEDTVALCVMSFSNIARRCGIELSPGESMALRELWLDISPGVYDRHDFCAREVLCVSRNSTIETNSQA